MPSAVSALLQKARLFSFTIGQLTFGSFLLLLVVITATSMASVIAIRHIATTFTELERLQHAGDLADEIDQHVSELRLAARDLVTNLTASDRTEVAASELSVLLKKSRLQLAPKQQAMIDGASQGLADYREGIQRVSALIRRRAKLLAGLSPIRARFEQALADTSNRATALSLFRIYNVITAALLVNAPAGAEQSAARMRALPIDDPTLRKAV